MNKLVTELNRERPWPRWVRVAGYLFLGTCAVVALWPVTGYIDAAPRAQVQDFQEGFQRALTNPKAGEELEKLRAYQWTLANSRPAHMRIALAEFLHHLHQPAHQYCQQHGMCVPEDSFRRLATTLGADDFKTYSPVARKTFKVVAGVVMLTLLAWTAFTEFREKRTERKTQKTEM